MLDQTMKPPSKLPLTLIVAATPSLGIGLNNSLPWRIKSELKYFARVTTKVPLSISALATREVRNAVVMGRKTWESIPSSFRPLKGRVNVVLSGKMEGRGHGEGAIWASSLAEALQTLQRMRVVVPDDGYGDGDADVDGQGEQSLGDLDRSATGPMVARVFVIGGATVYKAALELPETERVLLTKVMGDDWGCDTFFPVQLEGEDGERSGWKRRTHEELCDWVDEDVPKGLNREGDVEFEYCMFERVGVS